MLKKLSKWIRKTRVEAKVKKRPFETKTEDFLPGYGPKTK